MPFWSFCLIWFYFTNVQSRYLAFVGGGSVISVFEMNPTNASLTPLSVTTQDNPGWVSPYPSKTPTFLLSTGNNQVALYSILKNGSLTLQNRVSSAGVGPAYVSWNGKGTYALVANYGQSDTNSNGTSSAVLPVVMNGTQGRLEDAVCVVYHYGNSTNPDRQTGPHAHSILTDLNGVYTFVADLGVDKVYQYILLDNGTLVNNTVPWVLPGMPGDGPRHIAFHPTQQFAYVINEMGSSIDVFLYDAKAGLFTGPMQTVSTLPTTFNGTNKAAEIAVLPSGNFLYGSNRGYDSIVAFAIDLASTDFHLKLIGWTTYRVSTPRGFGIDPTGSFLLVGSSGTNEIIPFYVHNDTGLLVPTGDAITTPSPICIQIVETDN